MPAFEGIKVTQDEKALHSFKDLYQVIIPGGPIEQMHRDPRFVGNGKNSGFQALNLAVHFGAQPIILTGYDMHFASGLKHWFGDHVRGLGNPNVDLLKHWIRCFDEAAWQLKEWGVEVINCSPGSALDCFPKADIREVL